MNLNFDYQSISEIMEKATELQLPVSALILKQQSIQMEVSEDKLFERMHKSYQIMKACIEPGCDPDLKSTSGLTGGDAYKMRKRSDSGTSLTGSLVSSALYRALAVSEQNAAMGCIVAAPTAGSCGILPAALITMEQEKNCSEHACVMAMFTASAIGMVLANKASISGAEGGCQAECGSAAAMAAAAVTELSGGTPEMIAHAVAITLKNILGLVCDPVAGLVEIPCIKRNASGVANAFISSELALAGIQSAIPADEVIYAMKKVGDAMSSTLKETAEGGLAATPTARKLYTQVFGSDQENANHTAGCAHCRSRI